MSDELTEFIKLRKADVNNYENLLMALLSLKKYVEEKLNGSFYFGGKLIKKDCPPQTPDLIINVTHSSIVGEAKRSLRNIRSGQNKQEYIKEYIEKDLIAQIKKYDSDFENTQISNHELMLLAPEYETEALGIIKFDYLNTQKPFTKNFSIVVYSVGLGGNTKTIILKLDYGTINNQIVFDVLRRGIKYYERELSKELGKYKIYEENPASTPIEYVMLILWDSIFPEILNSSDTDKIIERYQHREDVFDVKLTKLMEYLQRIYILPSLPSSNPLFKENCKVQFKKQVVKDAMDIFCLIGLATKKSEQEGEIIYSITLKQLPEKNELDYFLKKIYEVRGDIPKMPDTKGMEPLSKYFNNGNQDTSTNSKTENVN